MATFTIHTFHGKINGTIVERGVKYFRKGYIRSITEKESQFWVARVEGTYSDYNVSVRLNNEDVSEWDCSCPFEGSVCKHVVAVLYDIRQKMSSTASPIAKSQDKHAFAPPQYKTPQSVEIIPEESPIPPMSAAADLYDYYTQELKDADKRLIKIGAMAWEALSTSKYSEIYNGIFSNVKHFEALSSIAIKTKLERLRKAGFFTENLSGYRINTTFAYLLCDKNWRLDKDLEHCIIPIQRRVDGNNGHFNHHYAPSEKLYRNLRFYYYMGDVHQLQQSIQTYSKNNKNTQEEFKAYFLPHVFNRDRADAMQPPMLYFLLNTHLNKTLFNLQKPDAYYAYAVEKLATFGELHKYSMAKLLNEIALLRGDWTTVETIKPHLSPELQRHTEGVFQLLKANNHLLAKETAQFFTIIQKEVRTYAYNSASYDGLEGILMFLALLKVEETAATKLVKKQLSHLVHFSNDIHYRPAYQALDAVLKYMENDKRAADNILKNLVTGNDLNRFFFYLAAYWVDEKWLPLGLVKSYVLHLEKNGYHWLAYEMNVLLRRLEPKAVQWQNALDKTPLSINGNPIEPLLNAIPKTEAWQNALKALKTLGAPPKVVIENEKAAMQGSTRVVWLVDFEKLNFQPKEQTMGKKGWTNGRMANFAKLREPNNPSLSEQDAVIMQVSQKESWDRNSFDIQKALPHFIGHPLLFLEKNPDISIDLSEAKPVLVAKELKEGYQVGFTPPINPDLDVQVVKETPTRYKLVRLTPELKRIAVALGSDKLFVPAEGKDDLQLALGGLVNFVPIQSALDTEGGQKFKTVEADNRICIHLLPVGEGIHAELLVRPFPDSPPYFKPADGEAVVFADIKNETVKTTRDLKLEKNNHKKLLESVEILRDIKPTKGTYELAEVGECLDLLLQLQPHLEDKSIILEWPKGEKYKLQAIAGFDDFRLDIGSKQDWFSVDGQLRVNENMVFDMKKLLEWIERMKNGFIEISPGQFLALKKDFLRKLRDIAGVLVPQRDGTFQMHPLALPVMEGFTEALVNADLHERYTESLDRLKKAFNTDFRLPKNFNATLRPYQKEGYEWLCRCAMWGVGACLADDMGLGKTVQALALVQRRSTEGATLVVAPASVCRNWVAEIEKFTPKLTPILFGEGDRAAMVEQAGKGDVVIVTYDLMAREADIFIQKQFTTIILDEAQAIKNRATRRSETAMQLQGGFKIAMSGTPLENHLGELWNLFQFINPGLLGSMEFFNERFASPIERYRDEERQSQLRNLVQPFILRRRKDEVLKELPAKTEIVLTVELSDKERAFYEALRRSVVEQLEAKLTEGGNEGQKQMQILAEIMRLRRAACHPKLVDDNVDIMESAKQKLFGDIVEELLENGHKALVFSQFVGHLTILKNYLEDKNIPYQYLDGSTPLKKRQERIEAFQKGEGAFFLISLKAGGVGLNLTEADFVLHMDPWWNPAVEDQATDRAHRIGQTKPVTVYRLVTEGTIEEKILKLHDQKRDLADSLLSGTDVSVRLSADELMDLIKKR